MVSRGRCCQRTLLGCRMPRLGALEAELSGGATPALLQAKQDMAQMREMAGSMAKKLSGYASRFLDDFEGARY